jgi:hypothetical protein
MEQFEKEYEDDINKLDEMMKDELSAIKDKYAELKKQRKKKYTQDKKQFEKQEEKAPRKTIPKALKNQVWDQYIGKDKGIGNCECCKKEIDSKHFECGHIIAVSTGGQDTIDNLRPICSLCNKSMGKMNMTEFCDKYMKPVVKGPSFKELQDEHHKNEHRIVELNDKITHINTKYNRNRDSESGGQAYWLNQYSTASTEITKLQQEENKLVDINKELAEKMNKINVDDAKKYLDQIKNDKTQHIRKRFMHINSTFYQHMSSQSFTCSFCDKKN